MLHNLFEVSTDLFRYPYGREAIACSVKCNTHVTQLIHWVTLTYHDAFAMAGVTRSHPPDQSIIDEKTRSQPEPTGINHSTRSRMEIAGGNWRHPGLTSRKDALHDPWRLQNLTKHLLDQSPPQPDMIP